MAAAKSERNGAIESYTWDAASPISRIDIRKSRKNTVAYIYTSVDESDLENLHAMRDAFRAKGWANSSDMRDGKSVLRVTGLQNPDELIDLVRNGPFKQAVPTQASIVSKDKPKPFMEQVRTHSLRASGIIYSIGNAFYIASGIARKKQAAQIGTGVAFSVGDVMVAIFGGKDDERQFKSLLTKLTHHLNKNGISIPKDSAISAEISTKGESLSERTYDLIHEHINKIKALAEVVGGFLYFKAGKDQGNRWKQATAVIFTTGFGSSLFIKEKKPDPEKLAHAGPLEKAWAWVQERPLRAAGYSGLSNTLFTTIGALEERKTELAKPPGIRTDHYKYDLGASASMLVANNLYALSNKSTGGAITSDGLINDLYGLVAQVLNREPEDKREAAIRATVDFLGERIEIKDTRKQIETRLREQMGHEAHDNPWFKARTLHETGVTDIAQRQKTLSRAKADGNWAHYVTQPETAGIAQTPGHAIV
jgi:hypothetical protein